MWGLRGFGEVWGLDRGFWKGRGSRWNRSRFFAALRMTISKSFKVRGSRFEKQVLSVALPG
jgi:hypothetical protein